MSTLQRIVKGPLFWIVVGLVALAGVVQLAGDATGYKEVPTSEVVAVLNGNEPLKEVVVVDGEQQVQITKADEKQTRIKAFWVGRMNDDIVTRLNQRVQDKTLETWRWPTCCSTCRWRCGSSKAS